MVKGNEAGTPLKPREAKASSSQGKNSAAKAIDGAINDISRWVSESSNEPAWLELDLGGVHKLAGIHLYSGYFYDDPLGDFVVQFRRDGEWQDIPSARIKNNRNVALSLPFDDTVDVSTDKLRLWITKTPENIARVLEVVVWPHSEGGLPPIAVPRQRLTLARWSMIRCP